MTPMRHSQSAEDLAERSEGFGAVAYPDPISHGAPWTAGYGHTRGVTPETTCDKPQAVEWLREDLAFVEDAINTTCTLESLTQDEFDALCDFGLNLGTHALETSTLWRKLMAGDIAGAAAEFEKWDMAGGHPVQGLLLRRQAEEALFLGETDGPANAST